MAWLLLKLGIASDADLQLQEVAYSSDPEQTAANLSRSVVWKFDKPVDAILDGKIGNNVTLSTCSIVGGHSIIGDNAVLGSINFLAVRLYKLKNRFIIVENGIF